MSSLYQKQWQFFWSTKLGKFRLIYGFKSTIYRASLNGFENVSILVSFQSLLINSLRKMNDDGAEESEGNRTGNRAKWGIQFC